MSNNTTNYSNQKKSKKKLIFAVLLLAFSILTVAGIVAAYYSDLSLKTVNITAGTLKISCSYTFYLNGTEVQLDDIKNLNPGDVIVVKQNVSNIGCKSAWIREKLAFNSEDGLFLPYLNVYEGEYTQADFLLTEDEEGSAKVLLAMSAEGQVTGGNKVVDGSGEDAETESGGAYDYIGSSAYGAAYTIYFLPTAGNETQGKTFGLTVSVQALQFRNNNSAQPNEAAWSTVSAVVTLN